MSEDRVFELYEGVIGNRKSQYALRDRLEWFFSRIEGGPVLDVGCSQGLLPILLARRGVRVVGLDISEEAIRFALNKMDLESPSVKNRLEFVCSSVSDILDDSFDVLVLGEVLEHVDNPKVFLSECIKKITQKGKALIQVPFGLHPHPDHFTVFYARKLASIIPPGWCIKRLDFRGERLCAEIGCGDTCLSDDDFLLFDEKWFLQKEIIYSEKIDRLQDGYERWKSRAISLEQYRARYKELKKALFRPWKLPVVLWKMFRN